MRVTVYDLKKDQKLWRIWIVGNIGYVNLIEEKGTIRELTSEEKRKYRLNCTRQGFKHKELNAQECEALEKKKIGKLLLLTYLDSKARKEEKEARMAMNTKIKEWEEAKAKLIKIVEKIDDINYARSKK